MFELQFTTGLTQFFLAVSKTVKITSLRMYAIYSDVNVEVIRVSVNGSNELMAR
ncbi:Uncharacterised protein [Enterobacter hormaechei]|nr:Uncharacterised protein [Enterobacter hormaechei]